MILSTSHTHVRDFPRPESCNKIHRTVYNWLLKTLIKSSTQVHILFMQKRQNGADRTPGFYQRSYKLSAFT